jgi:uncharacterized damage-inducible protein DinB
MPNPLQNSWAAQKDVRSAEATSRALEVMMPAATTRVALTRTRRFAMSTRAEQLADELQQVTDEVAAFIAGIPDEAWQRTCAAEQCTVAALACHIADGYGPILEGLVKPIAEGQAGPRYSMEELAQWNAAAAQENAAHPKAVAVERLRTKAPAAIAYVRGLSDEQLQRTGTLPFGGDPMTAEAVITHVLIGHPRGHLASIEAVTA